MSARRLTTDERATRQRVMMALRAWMTENDVSRGEVADTMGITTGHLSTLINANRTASDGQVEIAKRLMAGDPIPASGATGSRKRPANIANESVTPVATVETSKKLTDTSKKSTSLRPLTKAEGEFVANIAKAWLKDHKDATQADFVNVVRELGIAIRS